MGKNLNIIHDWVNGNNLRPTSINFVTGKAELDKKKSSMDIGESYVDDDGKEWIKTEYGWRSVPKVLTAIHESNPKCTGCQKEIRLDHRHDSKAYTQSKLCFDCMIDRDTQLKLKGQYKNFEKIFIFKKQRDFVLSTLEELNHALSSFDEKQTLEFINEFGDREKWSGVDVKKIRSDIEKDISEGKEALERINEQLTLLGVHDN